MSRYGIADVHKQKHRGQDGLTKVTTRLMADARWCQRLPNRVIAFLDLLDLQAPRCSTARRLQRGGKG